jgi:hypothetical protein
MLSIHLDVVGGIAGDMFVAAMIDALPELTEPLLADLAQIAPDGRGAPAFVVGTSGGLRARRFGLTSPRPRTTAHAHDHAGNDDHGTPYATLRATIDGSALPDETRRHALAILERLAHAEAHAHGTDVAHVHFHEIADWDSLLDIVAAGAIAVRLAGARWSASALPLGGGTVRTSHGVLPVPVPATVEILRGYPWRDDGVAGERLTPTGAAILRHLVPPERCGTSPGTGRLAGVGLGAGTRELPGMPNVLRVLVMERDVAPGADRVGVIEFEIDDMTGEEIGLAGDRLRAVTGVLDVSVGYRTGKKGRPMAAFRLLVQPAAADAAADACFRETSTLGLRVREEMRRVLVRRELPTPDGDAGVRVKVAHRPEGERTAKAEHDDVARLDSLDARREARQAAERLAKDER